MTVTESNESLRFEHPDSVRIDEQFSLIIEGLPAATEIDMLVSLEAADGTDWTHRETYRTVDGTLRFIPADSTDGTPDDTVEDTIPALIQQATPDSGDDHYSPPATEQITVTIKADGNVLGETTIDRQLADDEVTKTAIDSDTVPGYLFEPPGDTSTPGVVVLHGSGGEPATDKARLLASHGFVTAAIQYFGGRNQPDELVSVPIETVKTATELLLDHERVAGEQVGVIGQSKGGELALLAASQFDTIGAAVSINGSGLAWEGISTGGEFYPGSSWEQDNQPISYVPYSKDQSMWQDVMGSFEQPEPPFEYEIAYSRSIEDADEETLRNARIPVEEIDGPVLLVSGGDDSMWDSSRQHEIAIEQLEANDFEHEFDHLVYEDAGHAISFPYRPTANREANRAFVLGGSQEGYAEADAGHWPRVIETLDSLNG